MNEVKAIIRPHMLDKVLRALHEHPEFPGVTVSSVRGFGKVSGRESGTSAGYGTIEMSKLECIVEERMTDLVCSLIRDQASTGRPGDGKIVVLDLVSVIRIRNGETGPAALD